MKYKSLFSVKTLTCLSLLAGAVMTAHADQKAVIKAAMEQDPPAMNINTGWEIPSKDYCDQPYVVKLKDGTWLCVMTTAEGHEGNSSQHVVSTRSKDKGKTWSPLVEIEPPSGPEASWVMPYLTPYGRVYAFYTYNAENRREVIAGKPNYRNRVDTLGQYAFKYSDDGGKSWSEERRFLPIRETDIDRNNPYKGRVRFFWGVGKPITHKNAMYFGFTKVRVFAEPLFISDSEGWFMKSDNILTEKNPDKLNWQLLPDGENPIVGPGTKGSINSEVNLTSLSDGSLFCVYRTIEGHPGQAYSRDDGKTWTESAFMTYGPNGPKVSHPRAACPVYRLEEGPYAGRYLFWFHNQDGKAPYRTHHRNPAFLLGGVEVDGPDGKLIKWGKPLAILYDKNPSTRISYPDFIWDDGLYITETQKKTARVHPISDDYLQKLWEGLE